MQRPRQEKLVLSAQAMRRLELLQAVTNNSANALLEMGLALLVRQLLGSEALITEAERSGREHRTNSKEFAEVSESLESLSAGEKLKARREELQLTRVALAALCEVSEGTVRRYESNRFQAALVSRKVLKQFAKGLKMSEEEVAEMLGATQHLESSQIP